MFLYSGLGFFVHQKTMGEKKILDGQTLAEI